MKIAISATGPDLNAEVDPRFGRCQYFIIVDPETMQFEAIANESAMVSGGAGISAAQMIAAKGVELVLTGNCGPNAYQVLSPAGIKVITGVSGKIKDVIKDYRAGKFKASSQPNTPDHFGMGRGRGTCRGMGKGMGRGMGMGFSLTPPLNLAPQQQSPAQELAVLKAQSQALAEQLAEIQHRIKELEKKEKHSGG
jgi:predicted Fe-Mo cluster-binding NifX family protein